MKTPNDIEILIHYYVSPKPHPRINAGGIKGTIQMYLNSNILEINTTVDSGYNVTEKGQAWLQMILSVPYPKQVWMGTDNEVIKL